jgi:hypothetical protein
MSMYNLLFGANPMSDVLLASIGRTKGDFGRFRDCFVANGRIAVYTRNGGGNRDHWDDDTGEGESCDCPGCIITYRAKTWPFYSHDRDDDFDNTYATIYFTFPPEYAEGLAAHDSGTEWDPDARWLALLESLKATTPAQ